MGGLCIISPEGFLHPETTSSNEPDHLTFSMENTTSGKPASWYFVLGAHWRSRTLLES